MKTKENVLKILLEAEDFVSGETLAESLGITRNSVWKAVTALRTDGFDIEAVTNKGGVAFITADHGNADKMYEDDGSAFTAHTTNPVPFIVAGKDCKLREGGVLADIAPTMLKVLGLEQPAEMTRKSIIL